MLYTHTHTHTHTHRCVFTAIQAVTKNNPYQMIKVHYSLGFRGFRVTQSCDEEQPRSDDHGTLYP